jgi:hypothetical protein
MILMAWFVLFMVIGDFAAYFLGLAIEYEWGSEVSLIAFLSLYFFSLWTAYKLAVWITEPRKTIIETATPSPLQR